MKRYSQLDIERRKTLQVVKRINERNIHVSQYVVSSPFSMLSNIAPSESNNLL